MRKKLKTKAERDCGVCGSPAGRLYRVRVEAGGGWVFVCDGCWAGVAKDNPAYRYGGTWTGRARRG